MSGVSPVSQSVETLGQIMQMASAETIDMAKKQMEYAVKLAVGREQGKGQSFDAVA